jgi:hypothetical protein
MIVIQENPQGCRQAGWILLFCHRSPLKSNSPIGCNISLAKSSVFIVDLELASTTVGHFPILNHWCRYSELLGLASTFAEDCSCKTLCLIHYSGKLSFTLWFQNHWPSKVHKGLDVILTHDLDWQRSKSRLCFCYYAPLTHTFLEFLLNGVR